MKLVLTLLTLFASHLFFSQIGVKIDDKQEGNSGYIFNFEHTEVSNVLCDALFNIYNRKGTLVTLEQHALSFNFEKNSILNPSVANKFIGNACGTFYKDINISNNPIIEIEVSASKDCQIGFLVAGNVNEQFTYADGHGYKLQKLIGGQKTILQFTVPAKSWKGKVIDLSQIIGWGVQVKGPNGEPLPTLGEGRKINLYAVSFGESLSTSKAKATLNIPAREEEEKEVVKPEKAEVREELETKNSPQITLKAPETQETSENDLNYQDAQFAQNNKTAVDISMNDSSEHVVTTFIEQGTKAIVINSSSKATITVYNTYGEPKEVSVINNVVDLSDLPSGTYILRQGNSTTRFVKQ